MTELYRVLSLQLAESCEELRISFLDILPGGQTRMCEKFHQLLAVGRWFPPGTPVSSTRKLTSSSFHYFDMTLAVAEALNQINNRALPF